METFDLLYRQRNFPRIRPGWLALRHEPALLPSMPIVDTHHHFWDEQTAPYHADDLLADMAGGHAVLATVLVECRARYLAHGPEHLRPVGETRFAVAQAGLAAQRGVAVCQGIVGWADLQDGDRVEEVLQAHVEAGRGRFRGIRCHAAWSEHPALVGPAGGPQRHTVLQPAFQSGARVLAAAGLSLDLWLYHTQLDDAVRLARACPGTSIVLNHVGGPLGVGPFEGRRAEVFEAWRTDIRRLAGCGNVSVKLGGLAMPRMGFGFDAAGMPPSSETLAAAWRPYIETCIEAFGAERCMFESNFPVDKGMCSYTVLWNAFKRLASGGSASQQAALFHGTASRVYRLEGFRPA